MTNGLPKIALLGCGQWGRNLARNLSKLGVLHAVSDPNRAAAERIREFAPAVRVATADEIFADPGIDACVIATPVVTHAALATRALEAGKDVFVEKPLAITSADGQALTQLAERKGRILMVGHLLEYHPAVERLKALVHSGDLGKIYYLYSNRLNLGRIRTEENALWSFAPHDVHIMLRILGEEPTRVSCHGGSYLSEGVSDVTMSNFEFASGVRGHIFVSWLHPYKDHRLVVVGERKMAVFEDAGGAKLRLYPHRVDWIERVPVSVKAEAEEVPLPADEPLELECRHFIECIQTRMRPRTDGHNGVAVLRVLEQCQQSLEGGGRPVTSRQEPAAPAYTAHPTAIVDAGCEIGEGTRIWHYSHVNTGARIGPRCSLGQNVFVAGGVTIGTNVKIQNNVSIYEGVVLEDDVFCGPSMVFTNVVNPRSHVSRKHEYQATIVRRGATIGANATIVCGHTVGQYAFVAAGAVVAHDVPDHALMIGVPARRAGWMCQCGVRLPLAATVVNETCTCEACGAAYAAVGDRVTAVQPAGTAKA